MIYYNYFMKVKGVKMIFTRIKLKNISCFKETELDLSYPRKIKDSPIEYEFLEEADNFRFKRVCILMGANASGKTAFGKILCSIVNLLDHSNNVTTFWEYYSSMDDSYIEVEFTTPQEMMFYTFILHLPNKNDLIPELEIKAQCRFSLIGVPINKNDSVENCRQKIKKAPEISNKRNLIINNMSIVDNEESEALSLKLWRKLSTINFLLTWNFSFSDHSEQNKVENHSVFHEDKLDIYKKILQNTLKTFDPSIDRLDHSTNSDGEVTTLSVFFKNNGQALINKKGEVIDNKKLFSMGTFQGIEIANFLFSLKNLEDDSSTLYLDEKMAYSHSAIEQAIVKTVIKKLNRYSQFFYTTHNLDVLDMNLPMHSYLFLSKKNNAPEFIWGNSISNKNDRGLRGFVLNDCFKTLPNTSLLDQL